MENRCYGCMRIKQQSPRCEHCGYMEGKANELHQLPLGTVLRDQYVVGRTLGQGGFGITYLGWDQYLENPVAIKEYYPGGQVSRNGVTTTVITCNTAPDQYREGCERFMKEARTLSKLQEVGNIVRVAGFFKENNTAYIVMEYVRGITLLQYIKERGGKLTASEAFAVLRPVIKALHRVHEAGMIHRDISPDNIMLQDNGTVKILDFGTARDIDVTGDGQMTHSTQAVLKYGFAPAEQYASGRAIDRRADEYALCATIYYCLTGQTPPDAFQRLMDGTPMDWDAVVGLTEKQRQVLEKGTAIKAEDRYPDLKALEDALFGAGEEPVPPKKPAAKKKQPKAPKVELPKTPEAEIPMTAPMPEGEAFPETAPMEEELPEAGYEEEFFEEAFAEAMSWDEESEEAEAGEKKQAEPWKRPKWLLPAIAAVAALVVLVMGGKWVYQYSQKQATYREATEYLEKGNYDNAYILFFSLGDFKDSEAMMAEAQYQLACSMMDAGSYREAYQSLISLGDYKDSADLAMEARGQLVQSRPLAAGESHTVGLNADGTVAAAGNNYWKPCSVSGWTDIVEVSAGDSNTVGLRADGSVVITGFDSRLQDDISGWRDIIAVEVRRGTIVGLKVDGTVEMIGYNEKDVLEVSGWTDIVAVAASANHTVGVKADGTVIAAGSNEEGQCNVSDWTDIVSVAAGECFTAGLKADGTVVVAGFDENGDRGYFNQVENWTDIVAISAGPWHIVGLKADGTVVADTEWSKSSRCDVSGWTDIIAIAAGGEHTVGLKADGTVVAIGNNEDGQCKVSDWNIKTK